MTVELVGAMGRLAGSLGRFGVVGLVALGQAGAAGAADPAEPASVEAGVARETSPIDRHAVVTRQNVVIEQVDPLSPLTVGNGEFAFTADVTGLQSFPEAYERAIPLCTQSHWGWHTAPLPPGQRPEDIRYTDYDTYGRNVGYLTSSAGQAALYNWLRENPHRLHLGRIGLELHKADGSPAGLSDIANIRQTLDLWGGILTSRFQLEGVPVTVETCCAGELDAVAAKIVSPLVARGRLRVVVAFPYGSSGSTAADWRRPEAHTTRVTRPAENRATFARKLDEDQYHVALGWSGPAELSEAGAHRYLLAATEGADAIDFVCLFSPEGIQTELPRGEQARAGSREFWAAYWNSGGVVDLSASADPRAAELQRRIILSQYLLAVNCAGSLPPAETGLTLNSWYGKFHLEMHWWHGVQFALWGRWPLLEKSLGYYARVLPAAEALARQQGYRGARWPKMVGPEGRDSPSSVGPLLIWQQPHPIYYAELAYRNDPSPQTLRRWQPVVEQTAEFMASYAVLDEAGGRYALGPPLKTVAENTNERRTRNPTFELSYWRFGLRVAQQWRERLGLPRNQRWDEVLENLAPLPVADGVYLIQEGMFDSYTSMNWEHPGLVGALGVLPGDGVDLSTMRRTVAKVFETWNWQRNWGWDFPMIAMAAARTGQGELAVDALLLETPKNRYLPNGHNYQRQGLPLYLPGNGGLLTAVAMMAAGWDGAPERHAPGFPNDGQWVVRWEGLRPMP